MKKIGFACKWVDLTSDTKALNTRTTTITWLNRQTKNDAEQRLWELMVHNINSVKLLIEAVSKLPESMQMVRLSSDLLPAYTEPNWKYFWQRPDVMQYAEREFSKIGTFARDKNIRLSMHPGQYCVLASATDDVVERSIEDFEYHATMAQWLGYGQSFQDFKINVHISGKQGPDGIRKILPRLSTVARNCITIENDENSWGIDASIELAKDVALVLDIHHHFIHSGGEYIQPTDDRWKRMVDSWRGIRPVIHYSVSREDYLVNHDPAILPSYQLLLEQGYKKAKLRAHSDYYWNSACNDWALSFWDQADIMCESKMKNLAVKKLIG